MDVIISFHCGWGPENPCEEFEFQTQAKSTWYLNRFLFIINNYKTKTLLLSTHTNTILRFDFNWPSTTNNGNQPHQEPKKITRPKEKKRSPTGMCY
jgi:hypothetical protein